MGCEPMNFTCHFHAWDDDKWRAGKTYDEMKAEMNASGAEGSGVVDGPVDLKAALDAFANTTCVGASEPPEWAPLLL